MKNNTISSISGSTGSASLTAVLLIIGAVLSVPAPAAGSPLPPQSIHGMHIPNRGAFTLIWSTGNAAGYNVYRRKTLNGTPEKINSYLIPIGVFADSANGNLYYYSVRAVDEEGNESADSHYIDTSFTANLYVFSPRRDAYVQIPNSSSYVFKASENKFNTPLAVSLGDASTEADKNLVRQLELRFSRTDTGEDVTDQILLPGDQAKIKFSYLTSEGQVAKLSQGSYQPTALAAGDLIVYWNNGRSWLPVHAENEMTLGEMTISAAQGGIYQVRALNPANGLSLLPEGVYPEIITPNGDGINDLAFFVFENPNAASLTGEVFDLSGRQINTRLNTTSGPAVGSTVTWNGLDYRGAVVPSGEYIYRIKGEGRTFQGLVSVAR